MSWKRDNYWNLVISDLPNKLIINPWWQPASEHHCTCLYKYWKDKNTHRNAIFGLLDLFSIKFCMGEHRGRQILKLNLWGILRLNRWLLRDRICLRILLSFWKDVCNYEKSIDFHGIKFSCIQYFKDIFRTKQMNSNNSRIN